MVINGVFRGLKMLYSRVGFQSPCTKLSHIFLSVREDSKELLGHA